MYVILSLLTATSLTVLLERNSSSAVQDDGPDPLDGKDNYWTEINFLNVDGTTTATSVLRLKWTDSWTHDSKWHKSFFEQFRQDASNYELSLSPDAVKGIPDKTLQSFTGKVFKTLKEGYKEGTRPIGLQSLNVAIARCEKRQIDVSVNELTYLTNKLLIQKSKLAIEAHKNIPDIKDHNYRHGLIKQTRMRKLSSYC